MGWKLPHDFYPDCHIHFDMAAANASGSWPTGTNLLHVGQATDMLEYCIGDALRTALAERDAEIERLRADAARYQWWRGKDGTSVVIKVFGNGCINKTIEMAEAHIDAALKESKS